MKTARDIIREVVMARTQDSLNESTNARKSVVEALRKELVDTVNRFKKKYQEQTKDVESIAAVLEGGGATVLDYAAPPSNFKEGDFAKWAKRTRAMVDQDTLMAFGFSSERDFLSFLRDVEKHDKQLVMYYTAPDFDEVIRRISAALKTI